ncbi:MAG: iron ABC transporter permease [Caulobacteraceae bacterium]
MTLLKRLAPLLFLAAMTLLALGVGRYGAHFSDLFGPATDPGTVVLWRIRLPRVAAGLLVGAALAAAGASYQGLFRNPLVSPDILGVTAGASLGAVLGIFFSLPVWAIQALAFGGGIGAVALVYAVGSLVKARDPALVLVLAGVAVGAFIGALVSLLKVLADPYNQLPAITYWLLGSLSAVTVGDVVSVLPAMVLGLIPLIALRWRMNVMSLEDEEARALGVNTRLLRGVFLASATLLTAAAVSITGVIGWVGLLIPHVARMLVGPDFRRLLPAALMLGGGYLVGVDMLARSLGAMEIPLGVLTAAIGAPYFLYLLATAQRGWR